MAWRAWRLNINWWRLGWSSRGIFRSTWLRIPQHTNRAGLQRVGAGAGHLSSSQWTCRRAICWTKHGSRWVTKGSEHGCTMKSRGRHRQHKKNISKFTKTLTVGEYAKKVSIYQSLPLDVRRLWLEAPSVFSTQCHTAQVCSPCISEYYSNTFPSPSSSTPSAILPTVVPFSTTSCASLIPATFNLNLLVK